MERVEKSMLSEVEKYRMRLDEAKGFGKVYEIVKETVKRSMGKYRVGMMLFLEDLPLQVGAYHPVGTNNIIMNRSLTQIIGAATKSRRVINSFIYSILLHEYLHALGYIKESVVRPLVYKISRESFGEDHIATHMARRGPWTILRGLPLDEVEAPKRLIEVVKDFERTDQRYIV